MLKSGYAKNKTSSSKVAGQVNSRSSYVFTLSTELSFKTLEVTYALHNPTFSGVTGSLMTSKYLSAVAHTRLNS